MNKKEQFVMNLKWASPAQAIEELIAKVKAHENIHLQPRDNDNDSYSEFTVNFSLEIPSLLYFQPDKLNDSLPSWQQFEEMIFRCTGVYPRYADHEDHDSLYVEFGCPSEYDCQWSFSDWIESLEELLKVADMEGEIEDYVTNKLMEMKNEQESKENAE